ncbi:MAG: prolyl-tRNA synthetase associated domain-containing protein [bacterium]|nr:prolyl-tRNA synthetase associated domain-containing protein [bacterium]
MIGWYRGKARPLEQCLALQPGGPERQEAHRRRRELAVYELLEQLGISYERIDHMQANTMEACQAVDEALQGAVICKNLFLCNRQRTQFYLLMMPGDKVFKTKELSAQIGSSRLSFGEAVYMERYLHISPGSVSVMGLMHDTGHQVQLLIDRDILQGEYFGCHPCMNTSSIRLRMGELLEKFLPAVGHEPLYVELKGVEL